MHMLNLITKFLALSDQLDQIEEQLSKKDQLPRLVTLTPAVLVLVRHLSEKIKTSNCKKPSTRKKPVKFTKYATEITVKMLSLIFFFQTVFYL